MTEALSFSSVSVARGLVRNLETVPTANTEALLSLSVSTPHFSDFVFAVRILLEIQ